MAGLYNEVFIEQLRLGVQDLVDEWGLSPQTKVTLLNISENATFRADDPNTDNPVVVRVHRPGYHSRAEIESELSWISALRAANVVVTPQPLDRAAGGHIAAFETPDGPREVVAFEFMSGSEPSPTDNLTDSFRELGAINARLHDHARTWAQPHGFTRKTWTFDNTVGRTPLWGDWRAGPGLTPDGLAVLERTAMNLEQRLAAWGTDADRFGLIHADLRLANLLVSDGRIAVIDFDDCGFGWFGFDFAAAVSFIETDPQIPALMAAWIEGYRSVAPLSEDAAAMLPVFVMLRRMQLTAWIASHSETPTAQEMGETFTQDTVTMAERFLSD